MKVLFEMEMNNEMNVESIKLYMDREPQKIEQQEYVHTSITKTIENLEEIDTYIKQYSKGWKLNRIANVDLAILRLALTEMLHMGEIPYRVSVNEAIELGKKYSAEESASFINGILGRFIEEEEGIKNDD
ncbi:NusB antitermination factor [Alkaliphilus metalliredigens QYMF]|uniref:Transcription antitermination protein NusB n=2 Tax=Alkaliphilus TaxID=114627 RepID=A6TR36_ALKMQ|nr:NusB antitermination factor [Alkaliphilus metalliredigens QYMF]